MVVIAGLTKRADTAVAYNIIVLSNVVHVPIII